MGLLSRQTRARSFNIFNVIFRPAKSIKGEVSVPGDKSISHRAVMLGSIAEGITRIENFAGSDDCNSTITCMQAMGVEIDVDDTNVVVHGVGPNGLEPPTAPLDCGNSGTTMRLLAGILAGQEFESVVTGDESLQSRPMRRIIEPLAQMGVAIDSADGRAPITIRGRPPLTPIHYEMPVSSAQVKSCVLLAGLFADGETSVSEFVSTRDHTERMLAWFGVNVLERSEDARTTISLQGPAKLNARDIVVPGDVSSAAFLLVGAACLPGSTLTLHSVGLNPTRRAIIDLLLGLGSDLKVIDEQNNCNEPSGTIIIGGGLPAPARTVVIRGEKTARLIDEIPILAVLGTQLEHGLEVRDAGELRVKESDRISSVVTNLKSMGAEVTEFDDGFAVKTSKLAGATIDSFGDHRVAMAFAVAVLLAEGESEIVDA
ncbi:MAG: 3-phosphoshikimate 1-carboxyvinyltransferase, partial [Acidobacteria bacterium]|nr:3-phosphoshikimate 1-carboxyvinyltransferase [Acidobacteriota bacterium]